MKKIKLTASLFMAVLLVVFSFPVGVYAEEDEIPETAEVLVNEESNTECAIDSEEDAHDEMSEEYAVFDESDDACEPEKIEDIQIENICEDECDTLCAELISEDFDLLEEGGVLTAVDKPYITDISISKSQVKITFSRFMKPRTVRNISLKDENGASVGYTLEYSEDETDPDGEVIANEFTFILEKESVIFALSVPSSIKSSEGTSVTTGMNVKGVIKSFNPQNKTTVSLMKGEQVYCTCTIEAENGIGEVTQKFVFGGIPAGTYDLVVSKDGHIPYTVKKVVVKDKDVNLSEYERDYTVMKMIAGDINGDNNVNSTDWSILWNDENYLKSVENVTNKLCDINGDGKVNSTDWSILWSDNNYLKGVNSTTFEYVPPTSYETEFDPFF